MSIFHSTVQFVSCQSNKILYQGAVQIYFYCEIYIPFFALRKIRLLSNVVLFDECWEINMPFRVIFKFEKTRRVKRQSLVFTDTSEEGWTFDKAKECPANQ